jgi:hypothetical protein
VSDHFILGAYWGPRAEDVDVCADRTVRFFEELTPIDDGLAEWYELGGRSRRAVPPPKDQEQRAVIRKMLLAGRSRKDRTGEVMGQLGFSMHVWNGDWDMGAALRIHCGAYTARSGGNVVLEFPTRSPEGFANRIHELPLAVALIRAAVTSWEPGRVYVTPRSLREAQKPYKEYVGWLTYLTDPRPVPSDLPDGVTSERVGNGTLITLSDDSRQIPVDTATRLRERLERTGALSSRTERKLTVEDLPRELRERLGI